MQRLFFIIAFLCAMAFAAQAETKIPTKFLGCTLAQSTSKEVAQTMRNYNFKKDEKAPFFAERYNISYTFHNFNFNQMEVDFFNDTLYQVSFQMRNPSADDSIKFMDTYASIQESYGIIPQNDSAGYGMSSLIAFIGDARWLHNDKTTGIYAFYCDTLLQCTIVNLDMARRSDDKNINELANFLRQGDPDYDSVNYVSGVAGCKFGDSRQNVIAKFRSKAQDLIESTSNSVLYSGVSFGGNYFKRGTLYFINDKFISCEFETEFYTWDYDDAKMRYEGLCAQYGGKYTNGRNYNDDKEHLISYYGMLQEDYEKEKCPPIIISLKKGISRGGTAYYYVTLSYFQGRLKSLYNDEI